MKKVFPLLFAAVFLFSCVPVRQARKEQRRVEGVAGRTLPGYSISIEASYDPRLANVIYGYKLLPVVLRNTSLTAIPMDAEKDRWIVVGEKGRKYRAVNSLRYKDPTAWRQLPEGMRRLIDYPEVVPINYSVTFDLLLPEKANLEYFLEIRYYSAAWRREFVIRKDY